MAVGLEGYHLAEHFLSRWEQDETFTALLHAAVTHLSHATSCTTSSRPRSAQSSRHSPPDKTSAPAPSWPVASQVLGTALCRDVLRPPPVRDMPRADLTTCLGHILQRYLTASTPHTKRPHRPLTVCVPTCRNHPVPNSTGAGVDHRHPAAGARAVRRARGRGDHRPGDASGQTTPTFTRPHLVGGDRDRDRSPHEQGDRFVGKIAFPARQEWR
ncbi:hypothetical protein [Herbihabitans rhizosphaerae]|uniref:TetR/AcrR family transcriptional regulator n=1 Tax=Herbihabitans rhizosphaerae TaxID=1872711 RepID=UPI0013EEACA8